MQQKLTVLIPTYNSHRKFMQVLKSYEKDNRVKIIVSDDSDDLEEKKLIKSTCQKFNIRYINGPRSSPVKNWNLLLKNVDTPFFVLNHHDDYPSNLKFIDQLKQEKIGLQIISCSSKVKGKNMHVIRSWQQYFFSKICLFFPNACFNIILAPTASIVVNSKFKNIYFDENLTWFVDADWYLKLFFSLRSYNLKVNFFNKSRIFSIQDKDSITSKLKENLKEQIIKEKNYLYSKGLYPGFFVNAIQYAFLALILFISKFKQLLS